jgi:myo-inositol-1(or 4)-monophosphatase
MPIDLERMRVIARRAALMGGDAIRAGQRPAEGKAKGLPGDWVTEVDVASETAIRTFLHKETPDVAMLGEESGGVTEGLRWIVDPLDGTTNFLHRFPAVGVSVALVQDEVPVAGAIHAPFLGDTWHAARGAGGVWEPAGTTAERCHVSERPPERAVVGTGFPFRRKDRLPKYLAAFIAAFERFEDLRRPGAACLDLAWAACGVFDGFFELGLAPWDVAAGGLLVEEGGGLATDWDGGAGYLSGDILAGSPAVHGELRQIARDHGPA